MHRYVRPTLTSANTLESTLICASHCCVFIFPSFSFTHCSPFDKFTRITGLSASLWLTWHLLCFILLVLLVVLFHTDAHIHTHTHIHRLKGIKMAELFEYVSLMCRPVCWLAEQDHIITDSLVLLWSGLCLCLHAHTPIHLLSCR